MTTSLTESSVEHITWICGGGGSLDAIAVWVYLGNKRMLWILKDGRFGTRSAWYEGQWMPDMLDRTTGLERM